jgi:replication factor A1
MVDSSPVIAMKSLKVSDFQGMSSNLCSIFFLEISHSKCRDNCGAEICLVGVSLSTIGKSTLAINPDLPEAQNLKSW